MKMKKAIFKRVLSLALAASLLLGNIPMGVFAQTDDTHHEEQTIQCESVAATGEHSYESVITAPTCTEQGYTTYTCACGDSYVDDYVDATGHSYKNGICTVCKYEPSTTLVITEFVNGTYSSNALTSSPKTRLRHDPIPVKAGDQCSFSLPDGWSGYICLAYQGKNWDYAPKAWVQEFTYTFPADMDAFVVMRKDDGSVISPEEYAGEIVFTRKEAIPDGGIQLQGYYQKEIDNTIESVKALIGDESCLVFPMVSDIHYLESAEVPYSFNYFIANLKELAKEINFDFIACLGDITEGDTTQEITSERTAHIIDGFAQIGVPYYQVIGNHDDNRYGDTKFTHEQLYENYLSTITDVVFDTSSMHKTNYYKDFDDLGIRCVFLNANTKGAYGYSDETCDWFDEAIKTENGLIVFTHIPPVPAQNYGAKYGTDRGSTRIREACENADNFLIMFSGHNHYDLSITEPFLSFTMNCQKFENQNGDPNLWAEGAVKPQRVAGTETEDCFDIVVVRPESGRIDLVRFGAGEDRSFLIESMHTHSYTSTVTAPTCTEKGYTTYTCACGDSYVDNYVDATGHRYSGVNCTVCDYSLAGKTISILGDSISTYTGVSNNASYNATLSGGAIYYNAGTLGVYRSDTWWQQTIDALGLELCVNNSWSGSAVLHTRSGTAGGYVNRCVQLHNSEGEEPDIIAVFLGTNDYSYYQSKLGTADIDYAALITDNGDGTYTYKTPGTTCEAYAIMLHKMVNRYPDAEVYCLSLLPRRNPDHDGVDVVPAPTQFNKELKQIIEKFGCQYVDIESPISAEATEFDKYISDQRVHPGPLGMDVMTQALIDSILGQEDASCTVSRNLINVTANTSGNIVLKGGSYSTTLTANAGFDNLTVIVTMGGEDVTASVYSDGVVNIPSVTSDVVITASACVDDTPDNYRWEVQADSLVNPVEAGLASNVATKKTGTISNGVINNAYFQLEKSVVLRHDRPWVVEWCVSGTSWSGMLFSANATSNSAGNSYLFKTTQNTGFVGFGEPISGSYRNYGIALGQHGVDTSARHTYRVENRIADDGSNMAYLIVDGVDYGPMNHYFIGGNSDQGKQVNWLDGRDFVFTYIGSAGHTLSNFALDYISVWEGGHTHSYEFVVTTPTCTEVGYTTYTCECGDSYVDTYVDATGHSYENGVCAVCGAEDPNVAQPISMRYDDHLDMTGKVVEIVDAGKPTSYQVGYGVAEGTLDTAVVTLDGNTLIATGIGVAKVKIDSILYEVAVETAPINLFMIIGHSVGMGATGSAELSVIGPNGQVYSSYGTTNLSASTEGVGISYAALNRPKNVNAFTQGGDGTVGEGSALAWEYNRLTGEKVWVLNTAVGGSCLPEWVPRKTYYQNAVAQYQRAQEILSNEIASGHYTLSHMGILYHNGANFAYKGIQYTQQDLKNWYDAMWSGFKNELLRDMDGDNSKETVEFLGLVPIWKIEDGLSYTHDEPLGLYMGVSEEYDDVFTASVIGQDWMTNADVTEKFPEITYKTQNGSAILRPTTTAQVFATDKVHYLQVAYNAMGIDIAQNVNIYLNGNDHLADLELIDPKDLSQIPDQVELRAGEKIEIVPIADPVAFSGLTFTAEGAVEVAYPVIVSGTCNGTGKLTVFQGDQVVAEITFNCSEFPEEHTHNYETVITAPTCTEQGYTTYTCSVCGDSYVDDYVDQTGHSYESGICSTCGDVSAWKGKTAAFVGDSITAGSGTDKIYFQYLTEIFGFSDVTKMGIGGSCISNGSDYGNGNTPLINRYKNIPGADYIQIFMGTNDYGHATPIGTPEDTQSTTFYGALNTIIPYLVENHESSKIVFVTPLHRYFHTTSGTNSANDFDPNKSGHTLEDYVNVLKEVCAKYDVSVIDMYTESESVPELDPKDAAYFPDHLHPNAAGHEIVADVMASHIQTYEPLERLPELIHGNKFASGYENDPTRASARLNLYLKAGTVITFKDPNALQWACVKTDGETGTKNLGYFPDNGWSDKESAVVEADGWVGFVFKYRDDSRVFDLSKPLSDYITITEPHTHTLTQVEAKAPTCTEAGHEAYEYCSGCDYTTYKELEATGEHEYEAKLTTPTCTEKGYTTHTCHCGDSYVDSYVDAMGHKMGEWEITKEVSCTEDGSKRRDCERCDYFEAEAIGATGHNHEAVATAPTCTEQGYTTHTCSCGDSYVDTYVDALNHKWDDGVITKESTEDAEGTKLFTCERCEETREETLPKLDHVHVYTSEVTAPTCTEKGEKTYTCHCGDTYTEEIAAIGHTLTGVEAKAPTCAEAGYEAYEYCSVCDYTTFMDVPAKGHDYEAVVTAPTCTEKGYTTHTCACGDSYVDNYVNALDHQWAAGVITKEPTEDTTGSKLFTCEHCGETKEETLPKLDHVHVHTSEVTAPTCTEKGYTTHTCSCGDSYVDTYVDALGHDMGEWETAKEATCTKDGSKRRDCERCDHFETEAIEATGHNHEAVVTAPTCTEKGYISHTCSCGDSYVDTYVDALGHKMGEWETTKEASCTEDGEKRSDCSRCDHFETETIEATGHNHEAVATAPTCTEKGYTTHTCACGDSYVDTYVDALGHKLGTWETIKEATCIENGSKRRDCERCDHFETEAIEATGHKYEAVVTDPTCTETGYTAHACACGDSYVDTYVDALGHKMGEWETTKEASCTEDGEKRRDCDRCDYFETEAIEATGHKHETVVTAPTCTEQGYTTHTCSCGDSYIDTYVDALGHDMGEWEITKEATCIEDGSKHRDCERCNHYETETIEATGHNHEAVATAPTCTEKGYTTHTCACGDSYVDTYVDALGHKMGEWETTKEASCTENGEKRSDCSRCDHFEAEAIEATGHKYEAVVTAPTCTEKGYTTHTCKCGDSYVDTYVDALGHDMDEWETTKEVSCTENGEKRRDCERCDHFEMEAIEATGHKHETVVTAPTCTGKGYTTHTCHCGDSYIDTYVDALGHDMDEWEATKEVSCTENGEKRRDCERCDHFEMEAIEATGHNHEAVVTDPTCTEKGYTTHTCSCGDSYVDSYVDALGHKLGTWETIKEATCIENGSKRRDCERCDHFETEVIKASGHKHEAVVTAPTCTEIGYTTHTCKCGDSYVDNYVNALDHQWDAGVITKEPMEEATGSKLFTCERCEETREEILPALDHIHEYASVVTSPTYTEKGYTTHTCKCGDSYVDSYVDPLPVPEANIQVARMILGNELAMQFAFPKTSIAEGVEYVVSVTKTYADGRDDKNIPVPMDQWGTSGVYYYVSFNGIAAKEMSDAINVQILTADGVAVGDVYTDSVKDYAIRQLRKTTDPKTRTLYVDMLNYGAAAQTYFKYDAENLVTDELTETEKGYGTKSVQLENNLVKGDGYAASQLNLASSIQLRVKFNGIDSSMYAVVKFTNHNGREIEERVEGSEFMYSGTVVVINQVVAADYNQDVTIKVYDGDVEVANATESVASYLSRQLAKDNPLAIYDAVAKYCAAAYGYLHK